MVSSPWDKMPCTSHTSPPSAMMQLPHNTLLYVSTAVYGQVLIYTAEGTQAMWSEQNCQRFLLSNMFTWLALTQSVDNAIIKQQQYFFPVMLVTQKEFSHGNVLITKALVESCEL